MSLFSYIESKLEFKPRDPNAEMQAGDVLKLRDGSIRLVGHVNEILGVCDDCKDFESYEIVGVASIFDLYFCQESLEWKEGTCLHSHT